ncbi:MAG TPA: acyltransferase [Clostridiales bacterium]|nr:acyltransferase [Clostridiales bacterium]
MEKLSKKGSVPTKVRKSNLELYRIITMIAIVAHHYVAHSDYMAIGGVLDSNPLSWRAMFIAVFGAWGKIGINCFVLITGYFMCKSNITAKKFAKLFLEWAFYKLIISLIFILTGYVELSLSAIVDLLIPIKEISRGFTACYFIFFLTIPFLNILIKNLDEKKHIKLLLLSLFTYTLFGSLPKFSVRMNYVSWFIVLYFIASYIRLYPKPIFEKTKIWSVMSLVTVILGAASVIVCQAISKPRYFFVTDSNAILAVIIGVSSFMFFKNVNIKQSRFINTVSATTFGVLCIHANSANMTRWLWIDTLKNVEMFNSDYLVIHAFGSVLGIFIICAVIDLLRIHLIEKPFFKVWDKRWNLVLEKYEKIESKICKKFNIWGN